MEKKTSEKKGFVSSVLDKLDKKAEEKARKKSSCGCCSCGSSNEGGCC